MTKQEIIDLCHKDEHKPFSYGSFLYDEQIETIADTLFAEIEQEKKDLLKEFVEWLKDQPTAYTLLIYDRNKRKYLYLNEALEKFLEEKE